MIGGCVKGYAKGRNYYAPTGKPIPTYAIPGVMPFDDNANRQQYENKQLYGKRLEFFMKYITFTFERIFEV
jgi:hypothetical protein